MRIAAAWLCFLAACACAVVGAMASSTKAPAETNYALALVALVAAVVLTFAAIMFAPAERRKRFGQETVFCAVLSWVVAMILYPVFQGARPVAKRTACLSNFKQLALNILSYAGDFDDRLPLAASWRTDVEPYMRSSGLRCPESKAAWTYGTNRALSGQALSKLPKPENLVLLFETESSTKNAAGGPEAVALRHDGGSNFAFADGSARFRGPNAGEENRWKP
jgi:prepilin-type processing-associated H-X9-DG protein